jgi:hypothetical protein
MVAPGAGSRLLMEGALLSPPGLAMGCGDAGFDCAAII